MNSIKRLTGMLVLGVIALAVTADPARAEVSGETQFIFNTFSFLVHGFLVLWMAAGFAMLEAGLVRTKNTTMQLTKNIGLFSIAGIMFYLMGYNVMYDGVDGGFMGGISIWGADDSAVLADGAKIEGGYAASSDWFFQMVFVATAASIVSGTLAERIKLWPFMIFVVVLAGLIYPIQGSWEWGGGWLNTDSFKASFGDEFKDFAGSTLVHSVGGWAALTGAIILGARKGKYGADGAVHPIPGSNLPLATLGTFILWLGWLGFNGGSQLAMGSAADAVAISNIYVNTTMASAAGVVAAMLLTQVIYKKVDLTMALNGALAGLVSITAAPDGDSVMLSMFIGAVGGALVVFTVPLLDKLKIDDVVGAIPVHLVAGIWGTLAVALTYGSEGASFMAQLVGVVSIGAFVIVSSAIVWFVLKMTIGIRVDEEEEVLGLDKTELGLEAYPEFGSGSKAM
ncbi:ammonium transporter [Magnetospira sp. QH-2]|uniref:ammonium transporter n=1 Tax=Magnetospira sp. (strain QH-2) TaxID=1288970 RepID=UPI0003E8156D|nr:ammonium transporter [Magnetospira sp. QH-2]CCQ75425.1 putative ammonium transporter(AmtB-like) [Magnetospira sp. QH-2]